MEQLEQPWFRLSVGKFGQPSLETTQAASRVRREVLMNLWGVMEVDGIARMERALNGVLSGEETAGGYGEGGAWSFLFRRDDTMVVSFEYDDEGVGDVNYSAEDHGLVMPLADFVPLFRDWAASVRHWRALGGRNSVHLPPDKRPKTYPPKQGS